MFLSLDYIEKVGANVGGLVKKEISFFANGKDVKADVFVRPMSYSTAVDDMKASGDRRSVIESRILSCICSEDGSQLFTRSDLTGIDDKGNPVMVKRGNKSVEKGGISESLTFALFNAITEASSLGKKKS